MKRVKSNRKCEYCNKIIKETHRKFKREEKCGLCNNKERLEIHHFVYKTPVERKHITTLCKSCHSLIHRRGKNNVKI